MSRLLSLLSIFVMLSLVAGCTGHSTPTVATATVAPTVLPPGATPTLAPSPTDVPTVVPSPTNSPSPTATDTVVPPTSTPTAAPPTSTPTRTPQPVTKTPKPTQPPAPTKAPTQIPPTVPPSAPGVDLVAAKGVESCVKKFVSASFPWEEEPDGRKMYYWDKSWSVYPGYARPNIKFATVKAVCNEQKQCSGFTADFCVYVDGNAPSGGTYEPDVRLIIASMYPNRTGLKILTEFTTQFRWRIQ